MGTILLNTDSEILRGHTRTASKVGPHMGLTTEKRALIQINKQLSSFSCLVLVHRQTPGYSILRADGEIFN